MVADTLREDTLRGVTISVVRMPTLPGRAPLSVSTLQGDWLRRAEPQLTLRESLAAVPGVWLSGEANFAQDIRIAIRGFGARSAFGIRGIRLLLDGIPESAPDGQGQVDNLDLAVVERIEVLRGSSGGLYGNASGGVISLHTDGVSNVPTLRLRTIAGSWGLLQAHVSGSRRLGRHGLRVALTHQRLNGYREHSAMRAALLNARWEWPSHDSTLRLRLLLNYARSPQADDPGALTAEQTAANRRAAHPTNTRFNAGESVAQGRAGLVVEKAWKSGHSSSARAYALRRNLENRLPFQRGGQVRLRRFAAGTGAQHHWIIRYITISAGLDFDYQRDDRQRFDNLNGQRGSLELDQIETFVATGLFAAAQWRVHPRWSLSAGLRADRVWLCAADNYSADGDQSGRSTYARLSPWAGLTGSLGDRLQMRANWATHFETPTLGELSNNPYGTGGFHPNLRPQRTQTWEIGLQTNPKKPFQANATLFWATTYDELTPFERPQTPGRLYYQNAGQTQRAGLELTLITRPTPTLAAELTWTSAAFRYVRYSTPAGNFDGNRLPALPQHWGLLDVRYGADRGWFARAQVRYLGDYFADDANQTLIAPVTLLQIRVGYRHCRQRHTLEVFAGADNANQAAYFHHIRPNAAAGRFFEPAAGRTLFAGMLWEWKQ
ncbi:MAG: TonB-dependent receptor [Saprospiraceae bacterium]|nr:TonB-dependent receptor [Saprospiraceae bacterium]MDW8230524.1 TonB-dependent receptor [Saprospiraceae bacterium]